MADPVRFADLPQGRTIIASVDSPTEYYATMGPTTVPVRRWGGGWLQKYSGVARGVDFKADALVIIVDDEGAALASPGGP